MQIVDFSNSFIYWRVDMEGDKAPLSVTHKPPFSVNTARVVLDCRCVVTDKETGRESEFVLGASCKTERVGVPRDIWTEPNADFMPLYGESRLISIKTFPSLETKVPLYPEGRGPQPINQVVDVDEAFDQFEVAVKQENARALRTVEEVIESTLSGRRLVARTVIENDRYVAVVDYPIKTMNVSDRDNFYQTDTGPVLLPDLSTEPQQLLESFNVAFVAMNGGSWAEFLVRAPLEIAPGRSVYHYSRTHRMEQVQNSVFEMDNQE